MVDRDRQYFASQFGLPEPWATTRETPLSHSFCQWVVAGEEPLLVTDAREHPVLQSNRAVHDLGVIAYAGVPMTAPCGERIGAFCGIDTKPHAWTERDHALLNDFADPLEGLGALRPVDVESGEPAGEKLWDPTDVTEVLTKGIGAATRILRREGPRLEDAEREGILSLLDRQSGRLSHIVAERRAFPEPEAMGRLTA